MSGHRLSVIPAGAILDPGLKSGDIRVLALLGKYTNDSGWCYYSQVRMAKELNVSRSTVQLALNRLEEAGWVQRRARATDDGRTTFYDYRVLLDKDASDIRKAPPSAPEIEASTDDEKVDLGEDDPPCLPVGTPADISAPLPIQIGTPADPESAYPADPESAGYIRKIPESNPESLPPTPLKGALPPAGGEREIDLDGRKEAERSFKRFAPTWPSWVDDSEPAARRAWMALPPGERERAVELAPVYLAAVKGVGRTKPCALRVYLSERRWEKLAPATVKAMTAQRQELPAYGKAWMAWRLHLLATLPARPWQPTAAQRTMIASGKGHLFDDNRRNAKYPLVHALDIDAERGLGRRLKPGEEAPDADSFVRIKRGSDEWHAWQQWHQERDWPWINPPKHVEWVFVPSSMPSAGEATGAEQAA
jgi:DNA-binding MarR family transcriptional regulator